MITDSNHVYSDKMLSCRVQEAINVSFDFHIDESEALRTSV